MNHSWSKYLRWLDTVPDTTRQAFLERIDTAAKFYSALGYFNYRPGEQFSPKYETDVVVSNDLGDVLISRFDAPS